MTLFGADAFVRGRNGGELAVDSWPDKLERNKPASDLLAHDGIGTIVVEHTTVVTYADQVEDNVRARDVFEGFEERFAGGLERPGTYTLLIDPTDLHLVRREDRAHRLAELETWLRDQKPPYREDLALQPVTAGRPELWVSVQLYRRRCSPEENGTFKWAPARLLRSSDQLDGAVVKALVEKCPKLQAEKDRHDGSVSLLVLGSHDLRMANPVELMKKTYTVAQDLAADGRVTIPDAIIWVDTAAGDGHWDSYVAKNGSWSALATSPRREGLLLSTTRPGVTRPLRVVLPE